MADEDFWGRLTSLVSGSSVVVDRPKGSAHPDAPQLIYPLDYGYLTALRSGDGAGVDVWIGSLKRRLVTGVLCTVDAGKRDLEVKVLLGCTPAEQRRILTIHNLGSHRAVLVRTGSGRAAAQRTQRGGRSGPERRRVPRRKADQRGT